MTRRGERIMSAGALHTWIKRRLTVRRRLGPICTAYLLFLMVTTTRHSLKEAGRFSGLHPSLLSKLLASHSNVAMTTLDQLSKSQARKLAKALERFRGLPWKILLIIDATIQHRASLRPQNAKTFNHGKGYVIGHQWTHIVLVLGDILIPLKPIPFYSKAYCRTQGLTYQSEHERVVDYLKALDLETYLGAYDRRDGVVLTDSGDDDKKIEQAIAKKGWNFIIALSKTRSVKSTALSLSSPKSKHWFHGETFFRRHRRLKWDPVRLQTKGNKRTRMDVRIRHATGYLRYVGEVELVCSERRNRPDGRRKYLACNDLRATPRQIVTGYRLRWTVELWHKCIKHNLGFEEVATHTVDAVVSHVHWVYCAYILLHMSPPGPSPQSQSVGDKQRALQQGLVDQEKRHILQKLTQIGGVHRYKDELRQALADT